MIFPHAYVIVGAVHKHRIYWILSLVQKKHKHISGMDISTFCLAGSGTVSYELGYRGIYELRTSFPKHLSHAPIKAN